MVQLSSIVLILLQVSPLIFATNVTESDSGWSPERILSRKRRFLMFPEGSSLSGAVCMTVGVIGNPSDQFLSWAVNWGVAYDLPNNVTLFTGVGRDPENDVMPEEPKPVAKRRFRRDLYERLEIVLNSMGYQGRECILRAVCEAKKRWFSGRSNMLEEMIRSVFSLPKTKVLSFENKGILPFDRAHRKARSIENCKQLYKECTFSLLDVLSGRHRTDIL